MVSEWALKSRRYETLREVLILVLVEDGLGADTAEAAANIAESVLILVLVEDGLGAAANIAESLRGRVS